MANIKISALPSASAITPDDIFPIVDNPSAGVTKKVTAQVLLDYVTGSTFNTLTVTTLTGSTVSGSTSRFTNVSGSTITGSIAKFTTISGSTITGSTALFTSITASHSGSGAGLTSIPNGALVNSAVTIGTTSISLGGSATTIQGVSVLTGSTITGSTALFGTVGIGTTNPTKKLHVTGSDALINTLIIGLGNNNVVDNTAVGASALNANTTGLANTAIGYGALLSNTSGNYNTVVGRSGMLFNLGGANNTAVGYASLANNNANNSTGVGYQALQVNTSGASNTAVGGSSLRSNVGGNNNTAIGQSAGYDLVAGNNNLFLGYNAGVGITNISDTIILAANGEKMRVDSNGNLGIGTTTPKQKLHISGNIRLGTGDSDTFIASDADLGIAGDSDVLIVSDFNSTAGSPAADIIFGAGSNSNLEDQTFATYFPSNLPRVEYMRILGSNGRVGIGTISPQHTLSVTGTMGVSSDLTIANGNVVIGTSGKGIDFSITANGTTGSSGSVDSEILNDYEEGSWTVSISGSTNGGSYSYAVGTAVNQGTYTKIGNVVHVTGFLTCSATTPLTGNVYIKGFPFISSGAERDRAYALVGEYSGLSTNQNTLTLQFVPGTDFCRIRNNTTESTALNTFLQGTDLNVSNVLFRFTGFYFTA